MLTTKFAMKRVLQSTYEEALARLPAALATEGFGVLTEIDVKETLKKKIGVEVRPYRILGACNPPLAHQALQAEIDIGVMLPCNVIVYEGDGGTAVVAAIDPTQTIAAAGNAKLTELAETVRQKLARVLEQLS